MSGHTPRSATFRWDARGDFRLKYKRLRNNSELAALQQYLYIHVNRRSFTQTVIKVS